MANSNRIQIYARELINLGHKVKILIPKSKYRNRKIHIENMGVYEGVPYEFTSSSPYMNKNFLARRISNLISSLTAAYKCIQNKTEKILLVNESLYYIVLFKLVSLLSGSSLILEKSEVPFFRNDKLSLSQKIILKLTYPLFDAMIVITPQLENYIKKQLNCNVRTVVIPILIDNTKINSSKINNRERYILYAGSFSDRKDGVFSILETMAVVVKKFPDVKLYITGNASGTSDYPSAMRMIGDLKIKENIHFTGYVNLVQLHEMMKKAFLLWLVKPDNRQNLYNFPTKLGEYLISGTPVLFSLNRKYSYMFTDNEDIYLCELDKNRMAEKIFYAIENPLESENIGLKGKIKAIEEFNPVKLVSQLGSFLDSL